MREGWRIKKIGDVCDVMTGGTPSKNKPEYFQDGTIRWLVSGDIHRKEIHDCEGRITQAGLAQSNAKYLPLNSVMMALNGQGKTRGTVALLRTIATCNQSMVSICPRDAAQLLPEFLYVNLRGRYEEIRKITGDSGNDRRGLNMRLVRSILIPLPPVPEQERIVAILDEAFAAIATATANAEKNLANARELFASELNRVFSQKGDGWVETTLGEISDDFGRGKSKHRPRNAGFLYGGDYPFVQTGDIRNSEHIISSFSQTYSKAGLSQSKLWPAGTICITIAANIAETGILGFAACFPDSIVGMVPDPEKSDSGYVEYLLQFFKTELQRQGKGSAQDNINLGTFKRQRFPFAPLPEQRAIVEKLDALSKVTKRLETIYRQELTALTELKQSILQKAFTGELTADFRARDRHSPEWHEKSEAGI